MILENLPLIGVAYAALGVITYFLAERAFDSHEDCEERAVACGVFWPVALLAALVVGLFMLGGFALELVGLCLSGVRSFIPKRKFEKIPRAHARARTEGREHP